MSEVNHENDFRARVRVMQIVALALIAGVVGFGGAVVFVLAPGPMRPFDQTMMVTFIGVVLFATQLPMSVILPRVIATASVQKLSRGERPGTLGEDASITMTVESALAQIYLTTWLIGLALLEGAGMFFCVAYLIEHNVGAAVGIGLAILFMIARFPTYGRVRSWVDQQLGVLEASHRNSSS